MKVKKITILTLVLMFLLTFTGCGCGNNVAIQDGTSGRWTHVRATTGDYEEPLELYELADTTPLLEIIGNRIIFTTFWGSSIEGILTNTGENSYEVTDIVTRSEEFTWYSEETYFLTYDPESGLLRYTFTNDYDMIDIHHYFTREVN